MESDFASLLFLWLAHIDVACIVCNWDPTTQSYVPYAAGGLGAAAGGLGLNDLFGGEVGGNAVGYTGVDNTSHSGLGEPVNPDTHQTVPPGSPPSIPSEHLDRSDVEGRVAAEEAERERARNDRHARHPEDSTAPPPQPSTQETFEETVKDIVYHSFFTLGTR